MQPILLHLITICLADFLKTNVKEFDLIFSEKASKGRFLKPERLQNHGNDGKSEGEKERARRRKGGVKKKAMAALSVFIMATLEIVFARTKSCWT